MPVTLQVGERRFTTTREILKGSEFFAALTFGKWESDRLEDESYFVDVDPDIFAYILRYLRHEVLPVFYDSLKGHDFPLYLAVFRQAEYFQIPRLVNWLKEKSYLQVVRVQQSAVLLTGENGISGSLMADTVAEYLPTWKTERVYVCPRSIASHRGNPRGCGRQCKNEQGDREDEYEDQLTLVTVAISKRTIFNEALCLGRR